MQRSKLFDWPFEWIFVPNNHRWSWFYFIFNFWRFLEILPFRTPNFFLYFYMALLLLLKSLSVYILLIRPLGACNILIINRVGPILSGSCQSWIVFPSAESHPFVFRSILVNAPPLSWEVRKRESFGPSQLKLVRVEGPQKSSSRQKGRKKRGK